MKKLAIKIYLFTCLISATGANAQQEKYIDSLKIIPQLSGSNDIIKAVCFSHYMYEGCELDTSILEIDTSKNYIVINASHYLDRDRMESCYSIDTIVIGRIAAGTYTLDYMINTADIPEYTDRKVMTFTVYQATGIVNQVAFSSSINIYPNPAKDEISIKFLEQATSNLKIAITDLTGRCVLQKTLGNEGAKRIDISEIPAGAYTLTVFSDKQTLATQKLIKLE